MRNVLVIGGAGYIGTEVISFLLKKNFQVNCLDSLIYKNYNSLNKFKEHKNFSFIKADLRNTKVLKKITENAPDIILLAGLVGDPVTKKYPKLSKSINLDGLKKIIKFCKNINSRFIFISTCSNYGILKNRLATEKSKLNPQSLYAKHKVDIENYILSLKKNSKFIPTILRFSTAFGTSLRQRFDLTVNEFTLQAYKKNIIDIYDSKTWRPYCHIKDFSRAVYKVLSSKIHLIKFEVYNVGDEKNNHRKIDLVKIIKKYLPKLKYRITENKNDPRDYRVSFKKIKKKLRFKAKYSVSYGVQEIVRSLKLKKNIKNFSSLGNYKI
jgi:nucleoside-diphosphate-sugar epimerase